MESHGSDSFPWILLLLVIEAIEAQVIICSSEAPNETTPDCGCTDVMSCNGNGECEGSCKPGRFGHGCLFDDLVIRGDLELDPSQDSQWLVDGNKDTCNADTGLQSIKVKWDQLPYHVTWLRLHVRDTNGPHNIEIQMTKEDGNTSDCPDRSTYVTGKKTIDIHCLKLEARAKEIRLLGNGVKSLCGLYISGGINVARQKPAEQSSTSEGSSYDAKLAVDGNLDTLLAGESCTVTQSENRPYWSLDLLVPSVVNRFIVYSRDEWELKMLDIRVQLFSKDNKVQFEYVFKEKCLTYELSFVPKEPIQKVKFDLPPDTTFTENILTICELQMFGEVRCPVGKFGLTCNETCRCAKEESCFAVTGTCPSGCASGWYGETCSEVLTTCPPGTYGTDCMQQCSQFCDENPDGTQDAVCDQTTGTCLHGCKAGYQPPKCEAACNFSSYGANCTKTCSSNCQRYTSFDGEDNPVCHYIIGYCFLGCVRGFRPPNCVEECPPGTYGEDCKENCNPWCDTDDDETSSVCEPVNGSCLHGCVAGYSQPDCLTPCPPGKYGKNCEQNCSRYCKTSNNEDSSTYQTSPSVPKCNYISGACIYGCPPGYQPPNCNSTCNGTNYGPDCSQSCSQGCELGVSGPVCDPATGYCQFSCIEGYSGPLCDIHELVDTNTNSDGMSWYLVPVIVLCGVIFLTAIGLTFLAKRKEEVWTAPESVKIESGGDIRGDSWDDEMSNDENLEDDDELEDLD